MALRTHYSGSTYSHSEPIYRYLKDDRTGRLVRTGPMLGMRDVDRKGRIMGERYYKAE